MLANISKILRKLDGDEFLLNATKDGDMFLQNVIEYGDMFLRNIGIHFPSLQGVTFHKSIILVLML
jgi:hypothetical protein